jgi:hypothetical protein
MVGVPPALIDGSQSHTQSHPLDVWMVSADMSVRCGSPEHWPIYITGIVLSALVVFPLPLIMGAIQFLLVYCHPSAKLMSDIVQPHACVLRKDKDYHTAGYTASISSTVQAQTLGHRECTLQRFSTPATFFVLIFNYIPMHRIEVCLMLSLGCISVRSLCSFLLHPPYLLRSHISLYMIP